MSREHLVPPPDDFLLPFYEAERAFSDEEDDAAARVRNRLSASLGFAIAAPLAGAAVYAASTTAATTAATTATASASTAAATAATATTVASTAATTAATTTTAATAATTATAATAVTTATATTATVATTATSAATATTVATTAAATTAATATTAGLVGSAAATSAAATTAATTVATTAASIGAATTSGAVASVAGWKAMILAIAATSGVSVGGTVYWQKTNHDTAENQVNKTVIVQPATPIAFDDDNAGKRGAAGAENQGQDSRRIDRHLDRDHQNTLADVDEDQAFDRAAIAKNRAAMHENQQNAAANANNDAAANEKPTNILEALAKSSAAAGIPVEDSIIIPEGNTSAPVASSANAPAQDDDSVQKAAEENLLAAARTALRDGRLEKASELLEELAASHPQSSFAEERDAMRLIAQCRRSLQKEQSAEERSQTLQQLQDKVQSFRGRYPSSLYGLTVNSSCTE